MNFTVIKKIASAVKFTDFLRDVKQIFLYKNLVENSSFNF